MKTQLKQLIPGNPGTSFVISLLFALQEKYQVKIENDDQLSLYTKGIINSRNVFFSGVINEIATHFSKQVIFLSNSKFILNLAKPELNEKLINFDYNLLDFNSFELLLNKHRYLILSVDIFTFRKYHDYHFVCITRKNDKYEIFEPKSGEIILMDKIEIETLIKSVTIGLRDILMCFII